VAQIGARDESSSYYPPRARWYSRGFFSFWRALNRYLHLEKLLPPGTLSPASLLLSLTLPGYAFFLLRRRLLGWLAVGAYVIAAVVFVVALGFPVASLCYGLLISIHATSIVFLEGVWLKEARVATRLAITLLTLFAVWGVCYAPLVGYAEHHWCMPLRLGNRVVIVHAGVSPRSIKRGDWLAYQVRGDSSFLDREGNVILDAGMGFDPVLALPGDSVEFTRDACFVNGQALPRAPHMPVGGEWVMPQKVWFIWPSLGITGHGNVAEGNISARMKRTAMVKQQQIVGRPFKRWFGRRQLP
jgi:hypothetical protein